MYKYSEHAPLGFGEVYKCLSVEPPIIKCVKYNKQTDKFSDLVIAKPLGQCTPIPYQCYDKDFRIQVDLAGRSPNLFLRMFYGNGHTAQITGIMKDKCDVYMPYRNLSLNNNGPFDNTSTFRITGSTAWRINDNNDMMEQHLANDFTIEFWAYPTSTTSTVSGAVIQFDHTATYRLMIDNYNSKWVPWVSSNGSNWDILNGNSASTDISSESSVGYCTISQNTWQHVAFVHHGTYWYMFVDGVLSMIRQRAGTWYPYSAGIQLCQGLGGSYTQWYGGLYDLRIWNTAKYVVPEGTTTADQGKKFFTPETEPAI